MKIKINQIFTTLLLSFFVINISFSQCFELGTVSTLSAVTKATIGFCPTPAQASTICDCPAGAVAVGYEGEEGNGYGGMVLSQFKLRCRALNSDGTLGATTTITCSNGTAAGNTIDGPIDAAAGEVLVGAEMRIGCAADAVTGESKSLADVIAGLPNTTSNTMTGIGGPGGSAQPIMYAPTGSVIIGMETFIDPGNTPGFANGLCAGVAWRVAPINNVACPATCSINTISIANISVCNDNGTPTNSADDTFTADVTVDFSMAPGTGSLNLSGDGTASAAVGSLGASSHTFTGVSMSANGGAINLTATFSADAACTLNNANVGTAPASCNTAPTCAISSISTSNISACDDNGTPAISGDDTFTADITVSYSTPPATGILSLSGDASVFVDAATLGANSFTFNSVPMSANGTGINLTATFSAVPACTLTQNGVGIAPNNCSASAPTADVPTMSEWGLIIFSLIIFTLSVVFGTLHQYKLAGEGGTGNFSNNSRSKLPFNKVLFLKMLPYIYFGFAAVFMIAIVGFEYELMMADVPGSILAGLVIAYLAHFVKMSSKTK